MPLFCIATLYTCTVVEIFIKIDKWHQTYSTLFSDPSGSGAIRLVRGSTTSPDYTSGVVQVWWNGQWGSICYGYSFDYDEANVICHQLGWSGASSYTSSQHDSR